MPIHILAEGFTNGLSSIPYLYTVLKSAPWILLMFLVKAYFRGASNKSERVMHSKVVMITGGTSGIGAVVTRSLAERGAQIVLLTQHPPSDPFLETYVDDLRAQTGNELIYAEQVDLSSLHQIRQFATKWVDNAPPRRLDMIILCAGTMSPPYASIKDIKTTDGIEANWGVNYLANFHLLSIMSPALRAQPADRDVRIIFGTCPSYIGAELDLKDPLYKKRKRSSTSLYGASKLALMLFAQALQKHLDAYERPDKQPGNSRVILVDPGWSRTPGMRRWLSGGSITGLFLYVVLWPVWWIFLKSAEQGAQTFLQAAMEAELGRGPGGKLLKECRERVCARKDVADEELQKQLWQVSEGQVEVLEKEGALKRAKDKQEKTAGATANGFAQETKQSKEPKSKQSGSRRSRKVG